MTRTSMIALFAVLLCLGCGGESDRGTDGGGGGGAAANAPGNDGERMLEDQKVAWAAELRESMKDGDPMFSAAQWTAFVGACDSVAGKIAEGSALDETDAEALVKAAGLADLDAFLEMRKAAVRLGSFVSAGGSMKFAEVQAAKVGLPAGAREAGALDDIKEECGRFGFTKQDMDLFLEHRQALPEDLMRWTMKYVWVK